MKMKQMMSKPGFLQTEVVKVSFKLYFVFDSIDLIYIKINIHKFQNNFKLLCHGVKLVIQFAIFELKFFFYFLNLIEQNHKKSIFTLLDANFIAY